MAAGTVECGLFLCRHVHTVVADAGPAGNTVFPVYEIDARVIRVIKVIKVIKVIRVIKVVPVLVLVRILVLCGLLTPGEP
jgi:hypothetical protein